VVKPRSSGRVFELRVYGCVAGWGLGVLRFCMGQNVEGDKVVLKGGKKPHNQRMYEGAQTCNHRERPKQTTCVLSHWASCSLMEPFA